MAKYQFTREDRQRGARNQPREARVQAGKEGFRVTMERHPWMFARLKHAPGMRKADSERFCPHGK